jgi:hypothetical protein
MRIRFGTTLLVSFLWMSGLSVSAVTSKSETKLARIKIRIWDTVQINSEVLDRAKAITQKAYEPAGIEIAWCHCIAVPTKENFECANPVGPNDISVRIYQSARDKLSKVGHFTGGAAIPLVPNGVQGIVFLLYDRLEKTAKNEKVPLEVVLGITMAHEIGHLVISTAHALEGIMRGNLTGKDWALASRGKLRFHPREVEIMKNREIGLTQIDQHRGVLPNKMEARYSSPS